MHASGGGFWVSGVIILREATSLLVIHGSARVVYGMPAHFHFTHSFYFIHFHFNSTHHGRATRFFFTVGFYTNAADLSEPWSRIRGG